MKNALLAIGSVVIVVIATLVADRVFGMFLPEPLPPGEMELVLPPHSEQTFQTHEFTYTTRTNSIGLRDEEIPAKSGEVYRIMAIGDSFTYGWGVEVEDTWLNLLEKNLREKGLSVETVNVSKPGIGPPEYAEFADRAIPVLQPDLVIVAILQGNDLAAAGPEVFEETTKSVLDKVKAFYPNFVELVRQKKRERALRNLDEQPVSPPQKTTAEQNRTWAAGRAKEFLDGMPPEERKRYDAFDDEVKEAFLAGNLNPYMVDLALKNPDFYTHPLKLEEGWVKDCIQRMGVRLKHVKNVAAQFGAKVIVVSIPHGPYVNRNEVENIRRVGYDGDESMLTSAAPDEGIRQSCAMAGLPFFEVTDAFRARIDDAGLYYELDEHFTPAGHRLFADALTPIIAEQIEE